MNMNLCIDIGNTRTKIGIFKKHKMVNLFTIDNDNNNFELENTIFKKIKNCIFSTTTIIPIFIKNILEKYPNAIELTEKTKLPFQNLYATPNTLGKDRLALIAAAISIFPNKNILVIGCGTCITFNFINSKNQFLGGSIHAGLKMRLQAMHTFTKKLPLLPLQKSKKIIANNTTDGMQSGITFGVANEINGIIKQYKVKFPKLKVLITGGDADFLVSLLKKKIFAVPNLTLVGLNKIIEQNV